MRVVLGVVLLALVSAASVAASGRPAACAWRVVLDRPGPQLTAVSAVSDRNVWAVGSTADSGVIMHWDGYGWWSSPAAIFPLGVAARSPRDVWVVGSSAPRAFLSRAVTEHWNGRRWNMVPVPGGVGSYLRGVSTLAPDVWAVGVSATGPLAVRWTGRTWKSALTVPADGVLRAVDGDWVAGTRGQFGGVGIEDPLIERLIGQRWLPLPTPRSGSADENLVDVDAVSANDVWAVGWANVRGGSPLVEHLADRVWHNGSVNGLPAEAALLAVVAFGENNVWAAGYRGPAPQRTLLAHWGGKRWTDVPGRPGSLAGLSELSSHDIWAVGGSVGRTLIERYSCTS